MRVWCIDSQQSRAVVGQWTNQLPLWSIHRALPDPRFQGGGADVRQSSPGGREGGRWEGYGGVREGGGKDTKG